MTYRSTHMQDCPDRPLNGAVRDFTREGGEIMSKSDLESELALFLRLNDFPAWETEHRFHPKRRWRFDVAWPEQRIAVEIQGGIHMARGGHNTAAGITRDCEKANEAIILGWRVLSVTADQIRDGSAVDWLRRLMFEQGAEAAPF